MGTEHIASNKKIDSMKFRQVDKIAMEDDAMPRGIPKKTAANGAEISKFEAVRRALKELGSDAMPLEIKDYLKKQFSIEMDTQNISNYKSTLKAKNRRAPKRQAVSKPTVATAPGGFSLEDIQAVKEVADRIGPEKVRQLADVLSK